MLLCLETDLPFIINVTPVVGMSSRPVVPTDGSVLALADGSFVPGSLSSRAHEEQQQLYHSITRSQRIVHINPLRKAIVTRNQECQGRGLRLRSNRRQKGTRRGSRREQLGLRKYHTRMSVGQTKVSDDVLLLMSLLA